MPVYLQPASAMAVMSVECLVVSKAALKSIHVATPVLPPSSSFWLRMWKMRSWSLTERPDLRILMEPHCSRQIDYYLYFTTC